MADRILNIKDVPKSPGTSWDMKPLFNPLDEDFTWSQGGKPYTIPSKATKEFPEFIANHLAKHLARKIVFTNAYKELEEKAKGQITPDNAKAVPVKRTEIMEAWLKSPVGKAPEKIASKAEEAEVVEVSEEIKEPSEEKLTIQEKRIENLAKARAAKLKKKLEESVE